MRKFKANKGFRKLNKLIYMSIIFFLLISMVWYQDLGYEEYGGTILTIQIFTILFTIGGLRHMVGSIGGAMSDGFDIFGGGG